jgi:hypothetical protein
MMADMAATFPLRTTETMQGIIKRVSEYTAEEREAELKAHGLRNVEVSSIFTLRIPCS